MATNQSGSAAIITKEFVAGVEKPVEILYVLYYRQGSNPNPQLCAFFHKSSDMQVVMERAKRHCDVMNYRFVYLKPFIVDLDKAERALNREG